MEGDSRAALRFLVPSLLGAFFFLVPVPHEGGWTIAMGVLSGWMTDWVGPYMPTVVLLIVVVSVLVSLWVSLRPEKHRGEGFGRVFEVSRGWLLLRVLGGVFAILIYFQLGPEAVWSESTGAIVLNDLATAIVTIFIFASLLLPLLTDFGLMEFVGTLLRRPFQALFTLPGRSCVDAMASWMAAAAVGVTITSLQYDRGYYSGREAAVIATNFSVVSLPFCLLVAQFTQLGHLFIPFYLTVVVSGLVAAMILPRIPPLSWKPDQYSAAGKQSEDEMPPKAGLMRWGLEQGMKKAARAPGIRGYFRSSAEVLFDIWFGLMPPLMFIATLGLMVVEFTPLMQWLSVPLIPVLEVLRVPEAASAAPALLVGFAEMFLPAVIAVDINSELTRFIIISVSITQLIYMSEVGVLILKTRIPLNFPELAVVFLLRTVITLPVVTLIAHGFVFR